MKNMVANYLKERLVEFNYPENMEIKFNLEEGYDDGVTFIGDLSFKETLHIMSYLLLNNQTSLIDNKSLEALYLIADGVELNAFTITSKSLSCDTHYSESMHFNENFDLYTFLHQHGEKIGYGVEDDLIIVWVKVCKLIKENSIELSKQLTYEAKKLFQSVSSESKVMEERTTANYIVRISEVPAIEDFDIDVFCENLSRSDIDNFIHKRSRMTGFMAEVIDKKTSETLGFHSISGVIIKNEGNKYGGVRKEIIHHAIFDAKERINHYAKAVA